MKKMIRDPFCAHERNRRHDQLVYLPRGSSFYSSQFSVGAMGRLISYDGTSNTRTAPYFSLHVIGSGEGKCQTRGHEYSLRTGDIFLFFPGETYHYFDLPDRQWSYYWFILQGDGIDGIFSRLNLTVETPFGQGLGNPLMPHLEEWFDLLKKREDSFCFRHLLAWQILDLLTSSQRWSDPVSLGRKIREYIDVAGRADVTVEELANYFQLNRSTLFQAYKKEFGSGIKDYLVQRRIHYASELLRNSSDSLAVIADKCGFSSAQYLCRIIRKTYGLTPDTFRRQPAPATRKTSH